MKFSILVLFLGFASIGCNDTSDFTGNNGRKKTLANGADKDKNPDGSDLAKGTGSDNGDSGDLSKDGSTPGAPVDPNAFAKKGQSLDAYLIVDVSGSLTNTDPACARFDAMKSFKNSLKEVLGETGDARVSVILFSNAASFHSTSNDFIKLSDADFDTKYKKDICGALSGTNPSAGFVLATMKMDELQKVEKKDVTSVLFFTDGRPTVGLPQQILMTADALKAKVNSRVFSILLGNEVATVADIFMTPLMVPLQFVTYVAGSKDRVRSATNAEDLKKAFLSFLGASK
jgi:hypothetical protein